MKAVSECENCFCHEKVISGQKYLNLYKLNNKIVGGVSFVYVRESSHGKKEVCV